MAIISRAAAPRAAISICQSPISLEVRTGVRLEPSASALPLATAPFDPRGVEARLCGSRVQAHAAGIVSRETGPASEFLAQQDLPGEGHRREAETDTHRQSRPG